MKLLLKLLNPLVKNRISVFSVCQLPITTRAPAFPTRFLSSEVQKSQEKPLKKERPKWGTNKAHRDIKLKLVQMMADPKIEVELAPLRESVKEQVIFIDQFYDEARTILRSFLGRLGP